MNGLAQASAPQRTAMPNSASAIYQSSEATSITHPGDASTASDNIEQASSCRTGGPGLAGEGKTRDTILRLLNGKEKATTGVVERAGPLHLLDLPLDILALIVKEITHTNDLTSLAMCHSALHDLAIPQIYSRFDIVWPDATTHVEPRSGVDALTYGLGTLVMAEDVFGEAPFQRAKHEPPSDPPTCAHCGHTSDTASPPLTTQFSTASNLPSHPKARRRRRGNYYATFTRKFSLGNGPADWVQEYMITKEGGKMLGTLVALALARMRNLETFIWDMPTGVLRDVWIALASLGDRQDGTECRLEKVWVRWHSNATLDGNSPPPSSPYNEPNTFPQPVSTVFGPGGRDSPSAVRQGPVNRVERPTFSILPPLKSLNVLDIDELAYLDEMSVLIGRSRHCLRELRIGIAREATGCDWTGAWEGGGLQQLPPKEANPLGGTSHYDKRLGGVLGVLMGHVYSIRQHQSTSKDLLAHGTREARSTETTQVPSGVQDQGSQLSMPDTEGDEIDSNALEPEMASVNILKTILDPVKAVAPRFMEDLPPPDVMLSKISIPSAPPSRNSEKLSKATPGQIASDADQCTDSSERETHPIGLHILELERVPLSVSVLGEAIDWSKLAELTILDCPNHERLWKLLRRKFTPRYPSGSSHDHSSPQSASKMSSTTAVDTLDYVLRLRKIHTNTVTASLIAFIKEALAPNTLEALFLQNSVHYTSKVSMDAIFRGPLRRHRGSLKQLSIDSRHRDRDDTATPVGFRKWAFEREVLAYITSGRMPKLRELAMAVDFKDWHFFLQRLPSIPHLRSLHIPFVAKDTGYYASNEAKELAMSIIDIITLRPEIELCYLGLAHKCFEVLETRAMDRDSVLSDSDFGAGDGTMSSEDDDDGDDDDADDDDGADGGDDGDGGANEDGGEGDETETEEEDADGDDEDSDFGGEEGKGHVRLRLREILFYDDKVAIFKARHGRI